MRCATESRRVTGGLSVGESLVGLSVGGLVGHAGPVCRLSPDRPGGTFYSPPFVVDVELLPRPPARISSTTAEVKWKTCYVLLSGRTNWSDPENNRVRGRRLTGLPSFRSSDRRSFSPPSSIDPLPLERLAAPPSRRVASQYERIARPDRI